MGRVAVLHSHVNSKGGRNESLPAGGSNSPSSPLKATVEAHEAPDLSLGSSQHKAAGANQKKKSLPKGKTAGRQSADLKNEPATRESRDDAVGPSPPGKDGPETNKNSHTEDSGSASPPPQVDWHPTTREAESSGDATLGDRVAPVSAGARVWLNRGKTAAAPRKSGALKLSGEPCSPTREVANEPPATGRPTSEVTDRAEGQTSGHVLGPAVALDVPSDYGGSREKCIRTKAASPAEGTPPCAPRLGKQGNATPNTNISADASNADEAQVPTVAKGCIVCVRVRPESVQEVASGGNICVFTQVDESQSPSLIVTGNRDQRYKFQYDYVFDQDASQEKVYSSACLPLVDKVLSGYSASIIAYGQTGAGKSYTMIGESSGDGFQRALTDPTTKGVTPRIIDAIFQRIQALASKDADVVFSLRASLMEIYNETVRDLLTPSRDNLNIRESAHASTIITDATEVPVSCMKEALGVVQAGFANRALGTTLSNEKSSRSHAIFQLTVRRDSLRDCTTKTSQLFLVDLAGSERVAKADSSGERLREAQNINRSLLALGNVISAVPSGGGSKKHIPYRESKLTRLLQHSFGGNSFTVVLLCCSPHSFNVRETLSTLRFGDRAAHLRNKPQSVETLSPDLLQKRLIEAQTELRFSQARLRACVTQNARQLEALKMLQKYIPPDARLTHDDSILLEKALAGYDLLEISSQQPPRGVSPKPGVSRPKSKPAMPPFQPWKSLPQNRGTSVSPLTGFESQPAGHLKDPTRGNRLPLQPKGAAACSPEDTAFRAKACPPPRQNGPPLSLFERGQRQDKFETEEPGSLASPEHEPAGNPRPLALRTGSVARTALTAPAVSGEPATTSTPEVKPQTPPAQQPEPSPQSAPATPPKNHSVADRVAAASADAGREPAEAAGKTPEARARQEHSPEDDGPSDSGNKSTPAAKPLQEKQASRLLRFFSLSRGKAAKSKDEPTPKSP